MEDDPFPAAHVEAVEAKGSVGVQAVEAQGHRLGDELGAARGALPPPRVAVVARARGQLAGARQLGLAAAVEQDVVERPPLARPRHLKRRPVTEAVVRGFMTASAY